MSEPLQPSGESSTAGTNPVVRAIAAFGHFWWDFLVGDTPELFVATLIVIGLALAFHRSQTVAIVVVLVAVLGMLAMSIWRGRKRMK